MTKRVSLIWLGVITLCLGLYLWKSGDTSPPPKYTIELEYTLLSAGTNQYLKREIRDTLVENGMYSDHMYQLLLGTAATESDFGRITKQLKGPALGYYQIEPKTANDIWTDYLAYHPLLKKKVEATLWKHVDMKTQLRYNLKYQTVLAVVHYKRAEEKYGQHTPRNGNLWSLGWWWKKTFNSYKGKGTTTRFKQKYEEHILGEN